MADPITPEEVADPEELLLLVWPWAQVPGSMGEDHVHDLAERIKATVKEAERRFTRAEVREIVSAFITDEKVSAFLGERLAEEIARAMQARKEKRRG